MSTGVKPSAYLLLGKERFLKQEFLQTLRKSLFPQGNSSFNTQEFTAGEDSFFSFIDFCQTLPFLEEKRLAVLWDVTTLEDDERVSLLKFLDHCPASTCLVLASEESNVKKNSFLQELTGKTQSQTFHTPFDKDFQGWVDTRARKKGLTLERQASALLLERVGKDLAGLESSLETLSLYIYPRTSIMLKDVESFLGKSVQEDVFQLSDHLVDGNADQALSVVESLVREGTRGHEILAVLAGQFDRLNRSVQTGETPNMHPFFLEKYTRQVKKLNRLKMRNIFENLAACDEAIKTGKLADTLAIEKLVLEICLQKKRLSSSLT